MAQILQPTRECLDFLSEVFKRGGIAAIPTETVYGLACNALDPEAVSKVFEAKGRPSTNPLIVHIDSLDDLESYAVVPTSAQKLIDAFWPGPLTLIFPKTKIVPDTVTAGLDSVAIRMPSHPVFRELGTRCDFPIAAPSANPFGYVSPTTSAHVMRTMGTKIDWILEGGTCTGGIESTILSYKNPSQPTILRHGGIPIEVLESILGSKILSKEVVVEKTDQGLEAPGLLKRHYSPQTRIELFAGAPPLLLEREAIVLLQKEGKPSDSVFHFSEHGHIEEIAKNLYRVLQEIDQKQFKRVFIETPPAEGIGVAIRDRLSRAAAQE